MMKNINKIHEVFSVIILEGGGGEIFIIEKIF